jgi:hypothetical protein
MKISYMENVLRVTAEKREDKLILSIIAKVTEEMSYIEELSSNRVSNAQRRMHEATEELAAIKKSWHYRALVFIGKIATKLRRAK